jgi:hypothetical protein
MASAALRVVSQPRDEPPRVAEPAAGVELRVDWRRLASRVLLLCLAAEVAFIVLDYHINYGRLIDIFAMRRLFNTAREDGLASWFASTQTLLVGLTLLAIHTVGRSRGYLILAIGFLYMAVDDGAQLHERFSSTFDALTERSTLAGWFPSYTWHVLFLPCFAVIGLYLLLFLWRKLDRTRPRLLLVTAVACLAAAVAMDFFEGLEEEHPANVYAAAVSRYPSLDAWSERRFGTAADESLRHFSKSIEETLEMGAMSILWFVLLGHLGSVARDVRLRSC